METLSPQLIAETLRNQLKTPFDKQTITVEGLYGGPNNNKIYNGYIYCTLFEKGSDFKLTLKIHEDIVPALQKGSTYEFQGFFLRSIPNEVTVNFSFVVKEVVSGSFNEPPKQLLSDALAAKHKNGYRDIAKVILEKLHINNPINLFILTGIESQIISDVMSGLKGVEEIIELTIQNTNLSDPQKIISELESADLDNYDLLAIVRGGGNYLEVFNHSKLVSTVANLSTPIVTAIGHAVDISHTDMVADKYVATPTKLGQYLKDVCKDFDNNKRLEAEIFNQQKERERSLYNVNGKNQKQGTVTSKVIKALTFIFLGVIIGLGVIYIFPESIKHLNEFFP